MPPVLDAQCERAQDAYAPPGKHAVAHAALARQAARARRGHFHRRGAAGAAGLDHAGRALKTGRDLRADRLRNESVALGTRRTRRVRALVQCASRRDVAEARMATATVIGSVLSGIGSALSGTRGACRQDVRWSVRRCRPGACRRVHVLRLQTVEVRNQPAAGSPIAATVLAYGRGSVCDITPNCNRSTGPCMGWRRPTLKRHVCVFCVCL